MPNLFCSGFVLRPAAITSLLFCPHAHRWWTAFLPCYLAGAPHGCVFCQVEPLPPQDLHLVQCGLDRQDLGPHVAVSAQARLGLQGYCYYSVAGYCSALNIWFIRQPVSHNHENDTPHTTNFYSQRGTFGPNPTAVHSSRCPLLIVVLRWTVGNLHFNFPAMLGKRLGKKEGVTGTCNIEWKASALPHQRLHWAHASDQWPRRWNPVVLSCYLVVLYCCLVVFFIRVFVYLDREPLFTFDLNNSVGDVAWAPYASTVFAACTADGKVGQNRALFLHIYAISSLVVTLIRAASLSSPSSDPRLWSECQQIRTVMRAIR